MSPGGLWTRALVVLLTWDLRRLRCRTPLSFMPGRLQSEDLIPRLFAVVPPFWGSVAALLWHLHWQAMLSPR